MDDEGFEEWDADFLDQVIRVEERALSSSTSSTAPSQPQPPPQPLTSSFLSSSCSLPSQPPPPPPSLPYQSRLYAPPPYSNAAPPPSPPPISYSPPRELSQRVFEHRKPTSRQPPNGHAFASPTPPSVDTVKELEIERLKKELGRVSKQLASREQECALLRKEREEKEDQLKSASSYTERKVSNNCSLKDINQCSREVDNVKVQSTSKRNPAQKAVGVQTEKAPEATGPLQSDDRHACQNLSQKLLSIWCPPFDQKVGSGLVSKVFATSYGLFRCIGLDVSSEIKMDDSMTDANLGGLSHPPSLKDFDVSKVSRFYTTVVKVSDGIAPLEALLEPLVDLCFLDNVIVLYRSLCILHLILKNLLSMEWKPEPRDNIKIEGPLPGDSIAGIHEPDNAKIAFPVSANFDEISMIPGSSIGFISSGEGSQLRNGQWSHERIATSSSVDWVALFDLMHRIIKKNKEESVRLDAVCIMNLILLKSSSYEEREKFGLQMALQSVAELLKKECGSRVQYHALHLLFLLLNCPKILDKFCTNGKDTDHSFSVDKILQGLAGCLGSSRSSIEDLQLRRKTIMLLAFLASSGTAGFEILTNHQLPKGANFLMLILQALLSEWDAEASGSIESPEVPKERTLILREGLILLNRLVSNPLYSSTCLRMLTNSRDMVSLTVDLVSRMSQKRPRFCQFESTNRQAIESNVVDLARTLKKKIFAYLGDDL